MASIPKNDTDIHGCCLNAHKLVPMVEIHMSTLGRPYTGLPINFPRLAPNLSSCQGIQSLVLRGPHQLQFAWCQRLTFVEFCWVYYETRNMHFVNFTMRPFKIWLSQVILWRGGGTSNQGIKLYRSKNESAGYRYTCSTCGCSCHATGHQKHIFSVKINAKRIWP